MKRILVGIAVCFGIFMNGNCTQKGRAEVGGVDWDFFQKQWDLHLSQELSESDPRLRQLKSLIREDILGASGLGRQIFDLSKILKNEKDSKYDIARSTYISSVFAGYGGISAVDNAISVFLDLIRISPDDCFSNPLESERIEWTNIDLKLNLNLCINELRRLRLDTSKEAEYTRREKQLRKNLSKVFIERITSVDDLSSSGDSSGED